MSYQYFIAEFSILNENQNFNALYMPNIEEGNVPLLSFYRK